MAKVYVDSEKVRVFPAAGRSTNYPEGFLTTEDNLSGIVRSIYPNNNSSFVVDFANQRLNFVIKGYVFSIDTTGLTTSGNLFACIYLKTDLETGSYRRLASSLDLTHSLDEDGKFRGLVLDTENEFPTISGTEKCSLQLLAGGQIPATSKFQYLIDSDITVSTTTHAGGNTLNIRIGKN